MFFVRVYVLNDIHPYHQKHLCQSVRYPFCQPSHIKMILVTIQCTGCSEQRVGRKSRETVTPAKEDCPDCGGSDWEIAPQLDHLVTD